MRLPIRQGFLRAVAALTAGALLATACTAKPDSQRDDAGEQVFPTTGSDTERIGAPVEVPDGEDPAVVLAEQVMKGGQEGVAALATAVNLAGITIYGPDGKSFRRPTNPSIGEGMQAGEVGLLASLQQRGDSHLLIAPMVAFMVGTLEGNDSPDEKAIMAGLLADIRDAAAAESANTDKFIASFVIELEKRSAEPKDLSKEVADPAAVRLTPVSTALLLLRLLGGIKAAFPFEPKMAGPSASAGQAAAIVPVAYRQDDIKLDCSLTKDGVADDFIYDQVGNLGDKAKITAAAKIAAKAGLSSFGEQALGFIVSTTMTFLKLITAHAFFKPTMKMEPSKLERTRSASRDGAKAVVTATLRFDTEGWEVVNCFRGILSALGLDFSFKGSGPVKNQVVRWKPADGFTPASNGLPLVKLDSATPIGLPFEQTNDKGQTAATVIGHRQPKDVPENAKKVEKRFRLNGSYHDQPPDYWKDLWDSLGILAAGLAAGPAGAGVKLALTALERGNWFEFGAWFPVIDYGGDYRIDTTIGGIRFTGKVCNGPAGTWDITMKGEIKAMGQGWTYTGGMTAKINADGTGPVSGVLNGKSGGILGFGALTSTASFGGTAKLHDAGQTVWLEISSSKPVTAVISGPDGPISTGEGLPQTFTLPVDVGNFC